MKNPLVRNTLIAVAVAGALLAACHRAPQPTSTVSDLMADPLDLENVLMRCNRMPQHARNDADCRNARIAIERLGAERETAEAVRRQQEFEQTRERRRAEQERLRQQQEAAKRIDPYTMPVAPSS